MRHHRQVTARGWSWAKLGRLLAVEPGAARQLVEALGAKSTSRGAVIDDSQLDRLSLGAWRAAAGKAEHPPAHAMAEEAGLRPPETGPADQDLPRPAATRRARRRP